MGDIDEESRASIHDKNIAQQKMDHDLSDQEDHSLVFHLIWDLVIHPRYILRKRRYADAMHSLMCFTGISSREKNLKGMMEILEYVSNSILIAYDFATPWYMCDRMDVYYPMHIRALDLTVHRDHIPRQANTLGGYRI